MHLDGFEQIDTCAGSKDAKMCTGEKILFEEEDEQAAGTGEDLYHPRAYNRRLRAMRSPN